MNTDTDTTQIHLFDAPESKIRFLELTMGAREWKAVLHFPPFDVRAPFSVAEIADTLRTRGYHVRQHREADGHVTLHLHHLGDSPDVIGLMRDYGLAEGAAHVIERPLSSAKTLLDGVGAALHHGREFLKDPARANGLIFLTAEGFLILAAGGNPHGKWYQPKNLLQGVAGSLFASQSAAYLFWAQKGDDRIAADYRKQWRQNGPVVGEDEQNGFEALANKTPLNERPVNGWVGKARRVLEDHPIETGALLNNAGMLAYLAHAVLERRYKQGLLRHNPFDEQARAYLNKGFYWDVGGSALSILGWSALLVKPKAYEEKSDEPVTHLWQSFRENPQSLTAFTSLLSSSSRLTGALHKRNTVQAIGEGLYIPGDILLFFIKNHDYGASRHGDYEPLLDKIAAIIEAMPVIADAPQRESLYRNTARYLAQQHAALAHGDGLSEAAMDDEARALEAGLKQRCDAMLAGRFDATIGAARRLLGVFPRAQQDEAAEALAASLPSLAGLYGDTQRMRNWLCADKPQPAASDDPPGIEALAHHIGQLVFTIPGPSAGDNALRLYEALSPLMRTQPRDRQQLEAAMLEDAQRSMKQDIAPGAKRYTEANPPLCAEALLSRTR